MDKFKNVITAEDIMFPVSNYLKLNLQWDLLVFCMAVEKKKV